MPSATFTYQLKEGQNIRLGYNLRVQRPGIWYLNPFREVSSMQIRYGNPDLDVVKYHAVNLNYGFFTPKVNVNINVNQNFSNNSIENVVVDQPANSENKPEWTYRNVGKNRNTYLGTYASWSPNAKLRLNVNMGSSYYHSESREDKTRRSHGFRMESFLGVQYKLPWEVWINTNGGYYTGSKGLYSKSDDFYFYSLGLRKSFLKDKLNVSVRASHPFSKYVTSSNESMSKYYYSKSKSKNERRVFVVNISYRFGELKSQIKKIQRGIGAAAEGGGGEGGGGGAK